MYEQHLTTAGLTKNQALIYEALIKNGRLSGGDVAYKASVSRPLTYKVLDELIEIGLVEKDEKTAKTARFIPKHPSVLLEIAEKKKRQAETAEQTLGAILGQISSDFNLIAGRPNVRFFEGMEGMRKVLWDSLTAKTEIYTYADIESIQKYIPKINDEYVAEREKRGIKKRGILLDTPFARDFLKNYHVAITDTRLIAQDAPQFQTVMQIYNNKISYITLTPENIIGVIIEDRDIAEMHKYLFEYTWGKASSIITR